MIKGVDLSEWNENVDYEGLKASGVEFAMLRIGYGKDAGQKDAMFDTHYAGCKKAGIKVGVYHYSYCTTEENAIKEVRNCLEMLNGVELDLPVFYDLEDKIILENGVDVERIAEEFCSEIEKSGYKAGVYASLNWFNNYLAPEYLISTYYVWVAQWNDTLDANFKVDIWQNTNNIFGTESGRIDGDILINESLLDESDTPTVDVNVYQSLAVDVIYGRYGNGDERKEKLGEYYEEVQNIVNDMYNIIGG